MKKFIVFAMACLPFLSNAQTEGEILFTDIKKLNIKLPDDMPEEMKARIPTTNSSTKILRFNATSSIYQNYEKNKDQEFENKDKEEGLDMKIMIKVPNNFYYRNVPLGENTEQRELFGKDFLIKGKQSALAWKMSAETKEIAGYPCKKATCIAEKDTVTAWFSMQIPVSSGPGKYAKLPGMILELDINNGQTKITASKVDLKKLPENSIVAPDKGKNVSQEEFNKIEAEKRKEMSEMNGGRGGGMMMIKTDKH